eukprot:9491185-Pyramimonas_sp.AAC.1
MVRAYVHQRSAALSAGPVIRNDDDARNIHERRANNIPNDRFPLNDSDNYFRIKRAATAVYGEWAAKRAKQAYDIRLKREEASERAISVFKIVTNNLADRARINFGFTRVGNAATGIVPSRWYEHGDTGEPLRPNANPSQQGAIDTLTEHTNTVDRFTDNSHKQRARAPSHVHHARGSAASRPIVSLRRLPCRAPPYTFGH